MSSQDQCDRTEPIKTCLKKSKYQAAGPVHQSQKSEIETSDQLGNDGLGGHGADEKAHISPRRGKKRVLRKTWKSLKNMMNRDSSKERGKSRDKTKERQRGRSIGRTSGGEGRRKFSRGRSGRQRKNEKSDSSKAKNTVPWPDLRTAESICTADLTNTGEDDSLPSRNSRSNTDNAGRPMSPNCTTAGNRQVKPQQRQRPSRRHSCSSTTTGCSLSSQTTQLRSNKSVARRRSLSSTQPESSAPRKPFNKMDSERINQFVEAICADPTANIPNPFSKKTWNAPAPLRDGEISTAAPRPYPEPLKSTTAGSPTSRKASAKGFVAKQVERTEFAVKNEVSVDRSICTLSPRSKSRFIAEKLGESSISGDMHVAAKQKAASSNIFDLSTNSLFSSTGWESAFLTPES